MATDHNFKVKNGLHVLGSEGIYLTDTNTRLHEGGGDSLRITTDSGFVEIGSMNSGWVHFQANKNIYILPNVSNGYVAIDGNLQPYSDSTRTLGTSGTRWSHIYGDALTVGGAITSTSEIFAASGGNEIKLGTDGNIEITRTTGFGYIDFKNSASEDFDQRIQANSTGHTFSGTITSNDGLYATGVWANNNAPATDDAIYSGYGIIGSRGNYYITNAQTNGSIIIGVGGGHNANPKLSISGSSATFSVPVTATTINTGQGSTEVYLMNQNVRSSDSPTFQDLTIQGNLSITGDINSYNITDLDVVDKTITLGVGGTASANDGGGIIVDGANAKLTWNNTGSYWQMNKKLAFNSDATTSNQGLGLVWTGFDKEGTTDSTDSASIVHTINAGGHTGSVLYISAQNDANDGIAFITNASSPLKHNSSNILTAANFTSNVTPVDSTKLPLAGGTMTGTLNMNSNAIQNANLTGASTYFPGHAYSNTHDGTNVYWHIGSAAGSTNKVLNLRIYNSSNSYVVNTWGTGGLSVAGTVTASGIVTATGNIISQANSGAAGIKIKRTNSASSGARGFIGFMDSDNNFVASIDSRATGVNNSGDMRFTTSTGESESGVYNLTPVLTLGTDNNATFAGTIDSGAITSTGIIKSAMTGNAKLIADGSTHANVEIDRGNTSSHNNLLFRTAGVAKWRIWQSGADNILAVRNEAAGTNVLTFTDSNSAFAGTIDSGAITAVTTADATPAIIAQNTGGINGVIQRWLGDSDSMELRNMDSGDYELMNTQQNNGIIFRDGTGGVEIHYNGSEVVEVGSLGGLVLYSGDLQIPEKLQHKNDSDTYIKFDLDRVRIVNGNNTYLDTNNGSAVLHTGTTFGGDVSGTYNAIVVADDSHNHVISNVDGLQTALDSKLPLSGGTMTGTLTLPDTGFSIGNEYHKWKRTYSVSSTSPQEILYRDGNSLPTGGAYRFTAHIAGTGTDQSATAVFWNANGTWRVNVTGQSGTSSNHPEFIISSSTNKPTIHIDHTSGYGVEILHERIELSEGTGTDNAGFAFGTDGFLGSVNGSLYFTSNGTSNTGVNPYDDGQRVFADNYHPNANTLTTARTIAGTSFNGSANIDINYNNLTNKPTIPTNNNQLTNGAGYITDGNTNWNNSYGFITSSDSSITNKLPLAGGNMSGAITSSSTIEADILRLTDDATNTSRHRISVFDSGATSYGMMLWNTNGTSGDWATMIYGPYQSNRRISFGKVNNSTFADHGDVTESMFLDLDDDYLYIRERLAHYGDTNTYLRFTTDRIQLVAGGDTKFDSNNTYLTSHQSLSGYATESYVGTQINNLIDGAPGTLNTLNELAAAVADNNTFFSTVVPKSGGSMTGTLALNVADSLSFESGKHWITYNDGEGNFNIRVGHKSDSNTNEVSTETGYVFHDEWSQSSGWREFNISASSISAGADVGAWRRQMYYDSNSVYLAYRGSNKLNTNTSGISVNGNIDVSGTVDGVDIAARNGVLTTTTTTANAALPKAGGTMTGALAITSGGNAITINGSAPTILFNDTSGEDDFYIHVNSNRFYVLSDRDGSGNYETPHPLELNASSNLGYAFGHRLFTEAYHPNADILTTARTISLGGDVTGSASFNGSSNITITAAVVDNSHNHDHIQGSAYSTTNLNTIASQANPGELHYDSFTSSAANKPPTTDNANGVITVGQHSGPYTAQLAFSSNGFMYHRDNPNNSFGSWNRVFQDNYHPNADTLTTARTIAGTSFNGSVNIDISYNNLTNKPTIPTNNNQLTNGAGYTTYSSNQATNTNSNVSFNQVTATSNGSGTNFKVGDDAWIGDINVANTIRISGNQNANNGYITFGNSSNTALGRAGTGQLSWGSDEIYHEGHKPTLAELGYTGATNANYITNNNQLTNGASYITASNSAITNKLPLAGGTITGTLTVNGTYIADTSQQKVKYSVWSGSTYGIGMHNAITYGGLNDYGMTFQMNSENDRGFWWGDSSHTLAQGAMALTTNGYLTVANGVRIGYGETDTTTPSAGLEVAGKAGFVAAGNSNRGNIIMGATGSGSSKWSALAATHYNDATGSGNASGAAGCMVIGNFSDSTMNRVYIGGGPYEINPATEIRFHTHTATTHGFGGSQAMMIDTNGNLLLNNDLHIDEYIYHAGDTNTYIRVQADSWIFRTGGNDRLTINNGGITAGDNISLGGNQLENIGNAYFNEYLYHNGDTNTYIRFNSDDIRIRTGGGDRFIVNNTLNYSQVPLEIKHEGGNNATDGGRFLSAAYSGNNRIGTMSSQYSSGNMCIGNGLSFDQGNTGLVSTYGNFSRARSGVIVNGGSITMVGTSGAVQTAVDSAVTAPVRHTFNTQNGSYTATGDVTAFSDERLKDDIKVIDNAVEKVKQVRGVTFIRNDLQDNRRHAGVIAQEVEKVLPEVVLQDENVDIKTVAYGNMVGLLIEAIKEQQETIEKLTSRINDIEKGE